MYSQPFNELVNQAVREDIGKLSERISEERRKENPDMHRIYRLEEQKMVQGLFSNQTGSSYGKYRSPW